MYHVGQLVRVKDPWLLDFVFDGYDNFFMIVLISESEDIVSVLCNYKHSACGYSLLKISEIEPYVL